MVVRCAGCEQQVSVWADRCPYCRRSLDDAQLVPDPSTATELSPPVTAGPPDEDDQVLPTPLPTDPIAELPAGAPPILGRPYSRWPYSRQARVRALVGVALIGLIAGASFLDRPGSSAHKPSTAAPAPTTPTTTAPASSRHRAAPISPAAQYPAGLAAERLFFAEPSQTGLYQANGAHDFDLGHTPGAGDQPLVSGDSVIVYIHGGRAFRTSGESGAHLVDLGPASSIFPADHGAIGIESGGGAKPPTVEYMAANGTLPAPGSSAVRLPLHVTALAEVPRGLLVTTGAIAPHLLAPVNHLRLSLVEAHRRVSLGPAAAVIGTHGAMVAWIACRSSKCSLHLVNTTTGRVRILAPPAGYRGYALGGQFSPDGSLLATFVPARGEYGINAIRADLVRVSTGKGSIVGPPLFAGPELFGAASWSVDGHWLYFGGLAGSLDAQQVTGTGAHGRPFTLPFSTSFAVTGD